MTIFAQQNDGFFRGGNDNYANRDSETSINGGIQNDDFGAPLGSGLLILTAVGAGYAVLRRKCSRRDASNASKYGTLLLVIALILGMTNCKKNNVKPIEQPTGGNQVSITLNVDGGAKVNVYENHVNFETGDQILVASNGHYVGTLTHNGTNFNGDITDPVVGEPLYFYFLGNKQGTLTVGDEGCTVNISDQTDYPNLPVISIGVSINRSTGETVNYTSGTTSYEAQLHNKASLMKLNVTSPSIRTICITGMNNKVTVNFSKVDESGDGLTGDTDQGFSYSIDETDGGLIKIQGSDEPERWIIVLPQLALAEGEDGTAYTNEEPQRYKGKRPALYAISSNQYLSDGIALNVDTEDNGETVYLSKLVYHYCAKDGETLTGTLDGNYKISVNTDGATVTLNNVTIIGENDFDYDWAGITCDNNTTLVLDGTNTVKGFYEDYPGVYIKPGKTLIIEGSGELNASSNGWGAGIGGGYDDDYEKNCGDIEINGGIINAIGGDWQAGIGSGTGETCGNITINGGTVTATGGVGGAGIGAAFGYLGSASCGNITISGGTVTATGGKFAAGIGSGCAFRNTNQTSACGNITISGGIVNAIGGDGGLSGELDVEYGVGTEIISGGAGIGTGSSSLNYGNKRNFYGQSNCGTITIGNGVTSVTATKGSGVGDAPGAVNSIGLNNSTYNSGTCGTITIAPGANVTQN